MKLYDKLKKDMAFLGEEGLTAASASSICNFANEMVRSIESNLNSIRFYRKTMELPATGGQPTVCQVSSTPDMLSEIPISLTAMGELNSLIAWLREAIKAKDRVSAKVASLSLSDYLEEHGMETPETVPMFKTDLKEPEFKPTVRRPVPPATLDANDIVGNWTVKDYNRLFSLQARASAISKYIGQYKDKGDVKEGAYLTARKDYQQRMANPIEVQGTGQDTIIYRYESGIAPGEIEEAFFSLQQAHRALQAEYNGMVNRLENEVMEANRKANEEYMTALHEFEAQYTTEHHAHQLALNEYKATYKIERDEYQKKVDIYNTEIQRLEALAQQWRKDELAKVKEMKIIIPNELKEIYEQVKKVGK